MATHGQCICSYKHPLINHAEYLTKAFTDWYCLPDQSHRDTPSSPETIPDLNNWSCPLSGLWLCIIMPLNEGLSIENHSKQLPLPSRMMFLGPSNLPPPFPTPSALIQSQVQDMPNSPSQLVLIWAYHWSVLCCWKPGSKSALLQPLLWFLFRLTTVQLFIRMNDQCQIETRSKADHFLHNMLYFNGCFSPGPDGSFCLLSNLLTLRLILCSWGQPCLSYINFPFFTLHSFLVWHPLCCFISPSPSPVLLPPIIIIFLKTYCFDVSEHRKLLTIFWRNFMNGNKYTF